MNKKITLSVLLLFACTTLLTAQVGIGTTNPAIGSILDINSGNGGVLIPRVNLIETTNHLPIITPTPPEGLMVYNIAPAVNDVSPGFYYWNGSAWERMASGASTDWSLNGNAGTTPGTAAGENFIGTSDAQVLVIATNGAERMRVDASGNVGINTNAPAFRFHISNNSANIGATALSTSENSGEDGVALSGINTNGSNAFNAIEGVTQYNLSTFSPSGVFGLAIANSGTSIGVRGGSNSWQGVGIFGSRFNAGGPDDGWGGLFFNDLGYTGGFFNASDSRLKKKIQPINNAISILKKLNPVTYIYDTEKYNSLGFNEDFEYGLIAQEVKEILPTLVKEKSLFISSKLDASKLNTSEEGSIQNFLMIDYTRLIPITLKAIQEQQEIIDNQESRIAKLEALVNELLNKK